MLYHLSEEHEMLRQFVREFAESQLAPNAAKVDDKGVFAQQQYDALVEAGFAAPGIPEQYGGDGCDCVRNNHGRGRSSLCVVVHRHIVQ